eukprot:649262-Prymnesium_polylepis.2
MAGVSLAGEVKVVVDMAMGEREAGRAAAQTAVVHVVEDSGKADKRVDNKVVAKEEGSVAMREAGQQAVGMTVEAG